MEKMFSIRQVKAAFGLKPEDLQLPEEEFEKKLKEVSLEIGETANGKFMWACWNNKTGLYAQGPASEAAYEAAQAGKPILFGEGDDGQLVAQKMGGITKGVKL